MPREAPTLHSPPSGAHAPPSRSRPTPMQWAARNLFDNGYNAALTLLLGGLLAWGAYRGVRFVFLTGRWEIIRVNLTSLIVWLFPRDDLWRPWVALYSVTALLSLSAGMYAARLEEMGARGRSSWKQAPRRLWPLLALFGAFLVLAGTLRATLLAAGLAVSVAAARILGRRVPRHARRSWILVGGAGVGAGLLVLVGFGGVGWDRWGGLLLTIFLAVAGIVISFPLGVLLALGRRSKMPTLRVLSVAYIELIRGVPLVTLLFMGAFVIGLFFPPGVRPPGLVTRGLIALVLFTAAYMAEIVRGGLQAVPKEQVEAAHALGLSPVKTTRLIVLPQALRAVIPATVGQFISVYKDTSLFAIIGITELTAAARAVMGQPDFIGQHVQAEVFAFLSFVYWAGSYPMSRESQLLEKRLGLGER